jgi:hypothetical protein
MPNHKSQGAALFYIEREIAARKLKVRCAVNYVDYMLSGSFGVKVKLSGLA